jgi:hypothetical protein
MKITSIVSGLAVIALLGSSVGMAAIGDGTKKVTPPPVVTTSTITRDECTKLVNKRVDHKIVKRVSSSFDVTKPVLDLKHPMPGDVGTCTITTTFKSI